MSTRSSIAIQRKDGSIDSIYCHSDGYLEYNGQMLYEFYKDSNKVNNLIKLGDISLLNKRVEPDPSVKHGFDFNERQDDVVVSYGRDRGEINVDSKHYDNLQDYINSFKNSWQEYAYLYNEESKSWSWSEIPYDKVENMQFSSLEDKLQEMNLITKDDEVLENLICNIIDYGKEKDLYSFNDCYESHEDAYDSFRTQMSNPRGVKNLISEIGSDLVDIVTEQDLADKDSCMMFNRAEMLIKDLNKYKHELEKIKDNNKSEEMEM